MEIVIVIYYYIYILDAMVKIFFGHFWPKNCQNLDILGQNWPFETISSKHVISFAQFLLMEIVVVVYYYSCILDAMAQIFFGRVRSKNGLNLAILGYKCPFEPISSKRVIRFGKFSLWKLQLCYFTKLT